MQTLPKSVWTKRTEIAEVFVLEQLKDEVEKQALKSLIKDGWRSMGPPISLSWSTFCRSSKLASSLKLFGQCKLSSRDAQEVQFLDSPS